MTEEEILKEVVSDDDDLDKDKEKEDLEIVNESIQCWTGSVVMSALDTLSMFGIFNDASAKDDIIALLINLWKQTNIKNYFAPL